jgi:hypothetical protein
MSILEELKRRNVEIIKTDSKFRGIYETSYGDIILSCSGDSDLHCKEAIYFLARKDGKKGNVFPCLDMIVYIIDGTEYEGKVKTLKEAEQLAQEGKIYSFDSADLYAEYYDFKHNPNLGTVFKYGYTLKSRKYIEENMKNIGFLDYTDVVGSSGSKDRIPTKFDVVCEYDSSVCRKTQIGKLDDGRWIAQTFIQVDIDDEEVIKMYFDHQPSEHDLWIAFVIREYNTWPIENFVCEECGKAVNWLDIDGDIGTKYKRAKNRYCGGKNETTER